MSTRSDDGVGLASRRRTSYKHDDEEDSGGSISGAGGDGGNRSDPTGSSRSRSCGGGDSKKTSSVEDREEGCVVCKQDNDHANLMLCEGCNGEYHIYCLNPPMAAVPEGDWFCGKFVSSAVKMTLYLSESA